ncbi:MAG: peptidylprolyl isomerase [Wujia sp.]
MNKKMIVICMVLVLCLCTGCGKTSNEAETQEGTVVFTYGDMDISKGEVYIYINSVKELYESAYGENVWEISLSEDGDESITMESLTRQQVIEEIIRVKTYNAHVEELDIRLSDSDEEKLETESKEFYDGLTDADIELYELNQELCYQVMKENLLADMVEQKLLEDDPVEISDEQARMTTFYDMYFQCYYLDSSGNVVKYNEEQRKIQYENALSACSALATATLDENKDAENIENLAEYYKLKESKQQTMSPEEIQRVYGDEIYNILYAMENGEYSTVVESEYGYHVFEMIELTDVKATAAMKEKLTSEEIDNRLKDNFVTWKNKIDSEFSYPESIDMTVYDSIKLVK